MTYVSTVSTYLPAWGSPDRRTAGGDEDAVTMAVEAGRAALAQSPGTVERVVLVTRDLPLLEGGSGAVLPAALGLPPDTEIVERLGGAPATVDAILSARARTLVLAADLEPAGAGAVLVDTTGLALRPLRRLARSLPVRTRTPDGRVHDYDDPRLLRERGLRASVDLAALDGKPDAVAGVPHAQADALCAGQAPALPTLGASAAVFALAALAETGRGATLAAVEQATLTAAALDPGDGRAEVHRNEPPARDEPARRFTPGPEISISLAAYARAFEPKVRWEAARCGDCGQLAYPPRFRCRECGSEDAWSTVPLPRTAQVYTLVTVHVPVPGLASPYDLAVVALDGTDVRVLARTTAAVAGTVAICDAGRMVLRRVAVRSGVPDYGYAFRPDAPAAAAKES